jgi:hypothetical protein
MATFDVAHITESGVNFIIVPMHSNFGVKTAHEQNAVVSKLQLHANAAGLTGTVVPVWDSGNGRLAFVAPPDRQLLLRHIDLGYVAQKINKELSWEGD